MKLLIAEDDNTSRIMLTAVTKQWGYEPVAVENGHEAWQLMQQDSPPCLLLLDWEMPGMTGIDLCKEIRKIPNDTPPYILLLTGRADTEDIVEGLKAGANDYVAKPYKPAELQVRIEVGYRMISLQKSLAEALDELRFHATYDALTGIYNRRAILETLHHEVSRVKRQNTPLYVAMCDIDHFKKINDSHGHITGDEVIREIIFRIKTVLRDADFIGRYGGEEFLIICNASDDKPSTVFERMCKFVSNKPISYAGKSIPVTISCGVTKMHTLSDKSTEQLMSQILSDADKALYIAKDAGRNQVAYLSP
jgi:diguanylate cyclase (GGDEF)-like protein